MTNRNLYKSDDVLIVLSGLMLIPAAYLAWPWLRTFGEAPDLRLFLLSAPAFLGPRTAPFLSYLTGALCCQILGRFLRFREKQARQFLDALGYRGRASIEDLSRELGISPARARSIARKLSRHPGVNLELEGDRVILGRKKSAPRPSQRAPETKAPPSVREASPTAPPEVRPVPPKKLAEEIRDFVDNPGLTAPEKTDQLRRLEGEERAPGKAGEEKEKKIFPLPVMILLFLTPFWPVAIIGIIYNLYKRGILSPSERKEE